MFKRVVNAVEMLALIAIVVFVVLLAYRPHQAHVPAGTGGAGADVGAQVFVSNCASCHGARGEGGIGPKLAGGAVVAHFPDPQDQIAIVTNGEGSMPAWRGRLTPAQIQAVVDYTRTHL